MSMKKSKVYNKFSSDKMSFLFKQGIFIAPLEPDDTHEVKIGVKRDGVYHPEDQGKKRYSKDTINDALFLAIDYWYKKICEIQ